MPGAAQHHKQFSQRQRDNIALEAMQAGRPGPRLVGRKYGIPRTTVIQWQMEAGLRTQPARYTYLQRQGKVGREKPRGDGGPDWERIWRNATPDATPVAEDGPADSTEHEYVGRDQWNVSMRSATVKTPDDLIAACAVDTSVWEMERFKAKSYEMAYTPRATREVPPGAVDREVGWVRPHDASRARKVQLWSVSASFRRKTPIVAARTELAALIEDAKSQIVRVPTVLITPRRTGNLLELSIPDVHFGKLAWGRETGGDDYDLKLATEAYYAAVETLLARCAHLDYERVLYVVGNDALHADNQESTTTRGTRQDTDSRHFKVFQRVRHVSTTVAERLATDVAPTDIMVMPGNHDALSMLHLGDALACWFHAHPHVRVNVEPLARKYYEWGLNLLGFAHGDKGKAQLYSRLMPIEVPELWGRSRYREVHTAHYHKESAVLDEVNGVKVRVLPSLSPADAWHAQEGYVGNLRAAEAFVFNDREGLIGTANYTHRPEVAA